jgi:hypothetical protein
MSRGLKKDLNKNHVACAITVILMFTAFVIGGGKSLGKLRAESVSVFTSGAEQFQTGTLEINLMADLREYHGLAANTLVIAGKYFNSPVSQVEEFKEARDNLFQALNEAADKGLRADRLYTAFEDLHKAAKSLEKLLAQNSAVSSADSSMARGNAADMDSLHTIITRQSAIFNYSASSFNARLQKFPAVFFEKTGLVKPVNLFYN